MSGKIEAFRCDVPDSVIADLHERLDRTRWPDQPDGAGWELGTDMAFLKELCAHWRDHFDWREAEARFNAFPQFMTEIDGEQLHFYHIRSPEPDAVPLMITHGYPGSVAEFLDIFGPLSDPAAHGGNPRDAFHVIAPSIPGYGFSGPTRNMDFGIAEASAIQIKLLDMLSYDKVIAQGGDWGAGISTAIAAMAPERLIGLHLNFIVGFPPDPSDPLAGLDEKERADQAWKQDYDSKESGYRSIQGTKPQSLAYGMNDSPAGLAGWIVEKFKTWSDCGDNIENSFTKDQLLENIMLYWVTGTINSAMRLYRSAARPGQEGSVQPMKVDVPTGYAHFPAEIRPTPRLWAEQVYSNIVRWTEMPAGGHFAAFEQPAAFVEDVRAFAREFR